MMPAGANVREITAIAAYLYFFIAFLPSIRYTMVTSIPNNIHILPAAIMMTHRRGAYRDKREHL